MTNMNVGYFLAGATLGAIVWLVLKMSRDVGDFLAGATLGAIVWLVLKMSRDKGGHDE